MPQPLGSKEAALFRQLVRHTENRQYKKGLKTADQILRKNPTHGDTQAMKSLILCNQNLQDEAFALAKTALRNDMKSHICWHVYGLLYRADKNYDEAIKAYRFALKLEPDSPSIQRDLALLQVQIRDYQGYVQSRTTMLQVRPGFRQNWTALAVAHHLAGNLTEAEKVLTTYEETLKDPPPRADLEHSEAVLYKNTIIAESGDIKRALEHLDAVGKRCSDILAVMEMRADYLLRVDRKPEAEAAYSALLERNPDDSLYYDGLIKAKGIEEKDKKALKAMYDEWAEKYPRSDSPRRLPLDFLQGDDFREAADAYLKRMLRRGIPSTFANIKTLYTDPSKRSIVQELVEGYAVSSFKDEKANGSESTIESFILYFLAQHYNFYLSRDLANAMACIDKAIVLEPRSVEFFMTKARIYKHYGDIPKAAETMEEARTLDTKDRYINSKAAKYQLRNHENDKALGTVSKFTRNETPGGPLGDLHEMQCTWFLTEDGESYLRQKKLGLALKRLHSVRNIFDVWYEDQFDFHNFSLRRGMIRAYVDMIRWEDHLRDHPFYTRAAVAAIKAYILLIDRPDLVFGPAGVNGSGIEGNDENPETKKALKKAKREQQKLEKAEIEKRDAKKAAAANKPPEDTTPEDEDPLGEKLVHTPDPLQEAVKFLTPMLKLSPSNVEVQTLGFEVYIRQKKPLLALKCLRAANEIDSANPTVHLQTARFQKFIESPPEPFPPSVSETIAAEFTLLPKPVDLTAWNNAFLDANKDSAAHVQSVIFVRQLITPDTKPQNEKDLVSSLDLATSSLTNGLAGLNLLNDWGSSPDAKSAYISQAHAKWKEASAFRAS